MKCISIFCFFIAFSLQSVGQTEDQIILIADNLVKDKKYDSAFKVLQKFDPKNKRSAIVLLEENICLNYFVSNVNFSMFALKNLDKNEDIEKYRGKDGSFSLYDFPINNILDSLIAVFPNDYKLYQGLGSYYYEVHLKYGEQLGKTTEELFNLIEFNFKKAIDHHVADFMSYYVLGYIAINREKYQEAIPYFLKSLELNKDYASSSYNLAYAYLYVDNHVDALKYAKIALDQYGDGQYKGDAARMIAVIYSELKDEKKEIEFYELSNKIDPNNYETLKPLLNIYVRTNSLLCDNFLNAFFSLDPTNPTIYDDLEKIFYADNKTNQLIDFYKQKVSDFGKSKIVVGNLYFYMGRIYLNSDKTLAKQYFNNAKTSFSGVFDKDNAVFLTIDQALREIDTDAK